MVVTVMIIGVMQLSYNEKVVPDRFRANYLSFKVCVFRVARDHPAVESVVTAHVKS